MPAIPLLRRYVVATLIQMPLRLLRPAILPRFARCCQRAAAVAMRGALRHAAPARDIAPQCCYARRGAVYARVRCCGAIRCVVATLPLRRAAALYVDVDACMRIDGTLFDAVMLRSAAR